MNTKTGLIIIAIGLSLNGSAHSANVGHIATCHRGNADCKLSSSGKINLIYANRYTKTKNVFFTMNDEINGVLRLYSMPVKNKNIIRGEFIMNNTGSKKSDLHYRIVFKDKGGAVAQSKGSMLLNQGKNQKVKFGSIVLPKEDLKNINTYDIKISNAV